MNVPCANIPNVPSFTPPPHPTHVHIHQEPPPSRIIVGAVDPNTIAAEKAQLRQEYWLTAERPVYAVLTGLLNVGLVTVANFKTLSAISTFEPRHWVSSLFLAYIIGCVLGTGIMFFITSFVMAAMAGICRLFTGKYLFPGKTRHGQELYDPGQGLVIGAGFVGMLIAIVAWVIAGIPEGPLKLTLTTLWASTKELLGFGP